MGFGQALVLAAVSFFLGMLLVLCGRYVEAGKKLTRRVHGLGVQFINFNVDHRVLFDSASPETIQNSYAFYTTFFNAPLAIRVC